MPLPRTRTFGRAVRNGCARTDRLLKPLLGLPPLWTIPDGALQWGCPVTRQSPNCRNSMGTQPLQQLFPPGGIDTGATPASRMPGPATRSTQTPLPAQVATMRRVAHGATASRSIEVGEADLCVACAWTAAVGGPALPATVAAMSRAAKPKAGGLWTRERRAVVAAAVIAMRRCTSRVLGGWLRSRLASAAHVAERAAGR